MKTLIISSLVVDIDENDLASIVSRLDEAIRNNLIPSLEGVIREHGTDAVQEALDEIEFYGSVVAPRRVSPEIAP